MNGSADLARKKGEAGICLSHIKRPNLTDVNLEWVIGSDLREAWALERLKRTDVTKEVLTDESYVVYNELMYAQAWCLVAQGLESAAPSGGSGIDERVWQAMAERKMNEAKDLHPADKETLSKLNSAQDSFSKGRYGAAIFDALYVIDNELAPENNSSALNETRDSLWGRIYQSHAVFLSSQNQSAAAEKTARFARTLDRAVNEMRSLTETEMAEQKPSPEPEETGADTGILYLAAAAIAFLLIIVVILLIAYGKPKRPRPAYGAGQKKGRA
jgi:hypothetical protein